jgi:phosphoribosylamine---glycine ligase
LKVLVIGGGGREHAICWRLSRSASVKQVFAAPGNPGCAKVATPVAPAEHTPGGYLAVAREAGVDVTVVGPEAPLVDGIVDAFRQEGRLIVGPTGQAARLEGSKIFAKQFMERAGIATARYVAADDVETAIGALSQFSFPLVVKADGLAAGKGVVIVENRNEAEPLVRAMFAGAFVGSAGRRMVIEEYLEGEEVSFIGLSDGERVVALEPSQDHKRIGDDDQGPNTGGMGAYSDSRILDESMRERVMREAMQPVIDQMGTDGSPYTGFLYAGLMMTASGPKVLEYNVRLGDPETQALLHRMEGDFGALLSSAASGRVDERHLAFRQDPSICVVLAAAGYPGKVRSGDVITGIDAAEAAGAAVFHAATKAAGEGLVTNGGRVLGVTQSGATLPEAITNVYEAVKQIRFDGMQVRHDIGRKGLKRWLMTAGS